MKNIFLINDSRANRISFYHIAFFLAALPFDRIYSELALISLLLHTLIHLEKSTVDKHLIKKALLPASLYFVTCIGLSYSAYSNRGLFACEIQLSLLLFPVIFLFNGLDLKKYTPQLMSIFGFTCVLVILYLYTDALLSIRYYHLPLSALFSAQFINHNFSLPIDLHATYFSMYIGLCISFFIHSLLTSRSHRLRLLYLLCTLVLFAGLLQLASRAALAAVLIILCFVLPFFSIRRSWRLRFIISLPAFAIIAGSVLMRNETFRNRYFAGLRNDLSLSKNDSTVEPRLVRWQCAVSLIKSSPVIGHGSGSEIPLLKEVYFSKGFYRSYISELNAHNQYLGTWIETGVIGLLVLLFVLISGFIQATRNRDPLLFSFLVIVSVVALSEDILSVNKTIFFFAFFFSFLGMAHVTRPGAKTTQK